MGYPLSESSVLSLYRLILVLLRFPNKEREERQWKRFWTKLKGITCLSYWRWTFWQSAEPKKKASRCRQKTPEQWRRNSWISLARSCIAIKGLLYTQYYFTRNKRQGTRKRMAVQRKRKTQAFPGWSFLAGRLKWLGDLPGRLYFILYLYKLREWSFPIIYDKLKYCWEKCINLDDCDTWWVLKLN